MKIIWILLLVATTVFPLRIISTAPSITETMYALGAQDQLIAVSKYCNYPEEATSLPNIGGHFDFNRESFILINPELVMVLKGDRDLKRFLKKEKIDYAEYDNESIQGLLNMIEDIGHRTRRSAKARQLVDQLKREFEWYKHEYQNSKPIRVLLIVEQVIKSNRLNAAYILGKEDFYTPILNALQMENVYDGKMKYPLISTEALIHYNPDIILVLGKKNMKAYDDILLNAFSHSNLYFFDDDYFKRPGPRFTQILQAFSTVKKK